jgi:hypothetical protein
MWRSVKKMFSQHPQATIEIEDVADYEDKPYQGTILRQHLDSNIPIISKRGYFWDIHGHPQTIELIQQNLPNEHINICHMEIYTYLKSIGVLAEACIDNFVTQFVRQFPKQAKFILDASFASAKMQRQYPARQIYHAVPKFVKKRADEVITKEILDNLEVYANNGVFTTDLDMVNFLSFETYQVIRFHLIQFEHIGLRDVTTQFTNMLQNAPNIIHIFEIQYPNVPTGYKNEFLYHGTNYGNIYSILTSGGLRVPKQQSDVVNGQARGKAIYTAEQSATSYNYCTPNGLYSNSVMCIVQSNDKATTNQGGVLTFVNDNDVVVRYVIVMHGLNYAIQPVCDHLPKSEWQPNKKPEIFNLIEFDDKNILQPDEAGDFVTLDNGERIFIPHYDASTERPFIMLEDGSKLYDDSETYLTSNTTSQVPFVKLEDGTCIYDEITAEHIQTLQEQSKPANLPINFKWAHYTPDDIDIPTSKKSSHRARQSLLNNDSYDNTVTPVDISHWFDDDDTLNMQLPDSSVHNTHQPHQPHQPHQDDSSDNSIDSDSDSNDNCKQIIITHNTDDTTKDTHSTEDTRTFTIFDSDDGDDGEGLFDTPEAILPPNIPKLKTQHATPVEKPYQLQMKTDEFGINYIELDNGLRLYDETSVVNS